MLGVRYTLLAGVASMSLTAPAAGQETPAPAPAAGAQRSAAPVNTTGQPLDLVVPLRDRIPLGQVAIRIGVDDTLSIARADILAALSRTASSQFLTRLNALPSFDGYVSQADLAAAGLVLTLDPAALELNAQFLASDRSTQQVELGYKHDLGDLPPDTSADLAVFLAYQASVDWQRGGVNRGLHRPIASFLLDGRLFRTIAFENEFLYNGNDGTGFSRISSRMIYDRPNDLLRFEAGDLRAFPVGFQDQPELAGVGVAKLLNELRPDRVFTTSAGRSISLNEPATVTVLVNGIPTRTLQLATGNYDLSDLPLTGGANAVQLVIEDAAGGRRVVDFDFFLDSELLAGGVDEFSGKVGIRSDYRDGKRSYFSSEPIFTGFYRRGVTDQLTAGVNLQAARHAKQAGAELLLGTGIGLLSGTLAASRIDGFGSGFAARAQYRLASPAGASLGSRRLDLLAEYRSARFGGVETEQPANDIAWSLAARYFQPVAPRLSVGAGVDYQTRRLSGSDRYAVRTTASYNFANGIQLNGSVGYASRDGLSVGVSAFWRFGRGSLVTARYDSALDDARIGYSYSPDRLLDSLYWNVEASRSRGETALDGTAVYRTNRGDIELAHREPIAGSGGAGIAQTSLRARGAIAFADGDFALGRFLTDSFAIVKAHPTLDGAQVLVGSQFSDDAQARTGALGPALVGVSAYSARTIYSTVPSAPPGYDMGSGATEVVPYFHSGRTIVVGSEFNLSAVGKLLDADGKPLTLVAGTAQRVGDRASPTVEIFTNRDGKLGASGLAVGNWRMRAGPYTYDFVIEPTDNPYVNLGTLSPSGRRE